MAGNLASKNHLPYVAKILFEETDETCGYSLPQLQARLADFGVTVERKSLYRDFENLALLGMEIGRISRRPVQYYMQTRPFSHSQLMLLVDAVQTSKSITEDNSIDLIERIKRLTSRSNAERLQARVHVSGRVKTQESSIFPTLDLIQRAISDHCQISFNYRRYDLSKTQGNVCAHDGNARIRTPLFLVYADENYYMLAYDEDDEDGIRRYRVDRMADVLILGEAPKDHAPRPGFRIEEHERRSLGMYAAQPVKIRLHALEEHLSNLIDIFGSDEVEVSMAKGIKGKDGLPDERNWATVRVTTSPSPVLFGKIATFGGEVRIAGPKKVADAYREHIQSIIDCQDAEG